MSVNRRRLSFSSSRSRPVRLTDRTMPATTMPMIRQTTRISIRVNPAARRGGPIGRNRLRQFRRTSASLPPANGAASAGCPAGLIAEVPVTDIRIQTLAPGLTVGAHAEEVVLLAVRARIGVLVVVAPRVLADAIEIGALPVLYRRVTGFLYQRLQ